MLSTSDTFCAFRAVLVRNSATSSSDIHSWIIANASRAWKRGWSMVYFPCSLVSNQMYHRSTSFPMKCAIESMVYCSHLPNMVSTSWPSSQSEKGAYFGWIIKAVVVQNQSCQAGVCWRLINFMRYLSPRKLEYLNIMVLNIAELGNHTSELKIFDPL